MYRYVGGERERESERERENVDIEKRERGGRPHADGHTYTTNTARVIRAARLGTAPAAAPVRAGVERAARLAVRAGLLPVGAGVVAHDGGVEGGRGRGR